MISFVVIRPFAINSLTRSLLFVVVEVNDGRSLRSSMALLPLLNNAHYFAKQNFFLAEHFLQMALNFLEVNISSNNVSLLTEPSYIVPMWGRNIQLMLYHP